MQALASPLKLQKRFVQPTPDDQGMVMKKLQKLLIIGASGNLGSLCGKRLVHLADTIRVTAPEGLGEAAKHEEIIYGDLGDKSAVEAMVEGCDATAHLGAHATEADWETIKTRISTGWSTSTRQRANLRFRSA